MAVIKHNGHLGARQIDAGVGSIYDGAAVHGEVVQLLVISFQGHIACGHFKGKGFAVFPVLRRLHKSRAAGKLPAAEQVMFVRPRLRHGDFIACQRTAAFHAIYKDGAFSVVHRHIVNRFVLGFQGHVACGHLKGEFFAVLPAALRPASRRCFGFGICRLPLLELLGNIVAVIKHNGHLGARQIDAGVGSIYDGAAVHGEVVQLLVISFQGHIACGHFKGKGFAVFPVLRRLHKSRAAGKLPAAEQVVFVRPRLCYGDLIACQRTAACHAIYKDGAFSAVHRQGVGRFVFSFQGHVVCGHGKGKGAAVSPIRGSIYDVIAAGPLLELLCIRVRRGRNGHFGARQIVAGVAVSAHDGAAGHLYLVLGNGVIAGPQRYIACRHFKGEFFACLPTIGQACGLRAAERPLLELRCFGVRRGRNRHRFTGIELGVLSAAGRCGDAIRQGKGVKGVGFDAQIRRCAADGFAGMELCAILCSPIEIAIARRRRIGDAFRRLAAGVTVDDLYLTGIFNGRTVGNDRCRSPASRHGNAAAPFYIQSAENRRAAAVGNGNGSGGVNACTTLHKGRTAALIAGNDHLTGAVFHGEFITGHLTIRVAQLHFAGAGQGDIAADGRRVGGAAAHLHAVAVMYGQIAGHGKAGVVCVGNVHRAPAGDLGTAANRVAAFAAHRNIAGAAGVLHGQLAAHGNATAVADVHCTAAGNVGRITDSITLCVANNCHAGAAVDGQIAINSNAGEIAHIHTAACCNVGIAFDRSSSVARTAARHGDGITGIHRQAIAHHVFCVVTFDLNSACARDINFACSTRSSYTFTAGHGQFAVNRLISELRPKHSRNDVFNFHITVACNAGIGSKGSCNGTDRAVCIASRDRHIACTCCVVHIQRVNDRRTVRIGNGHISVAVFNFQCAIKGSRIGF